MATLIPFSILFRAVKKFLCTIVAPRQMWEIVTFKQRGLGIMTDNMAGLLDLLMDIFLQHCLMEIAFLDGSREQLDASQHIFMKGKKDVELGIQLNVVGLTTTPIRFSLVLHSYENFKSQNNENYCSSPSSCSIAFSHKLFELRHLRHSLEESYCTFIEVQEFLLGAEYV